MDPLRVTAELLFGLVFVFVGHAYLRRRDAISRDLVLAFAGLGLTFLVDVWRRVAGSTPPPIGIAVGVLLLLQPLFVLHLVSRIRDVPRVVLVGATVLLLGSVATAGAGSRRWPPLCCCSRRGAGVVLVLFVWPLRPPPPLCSRLPSSRPASEPSWRRLPRTRRSPRSSLHSWLQSDI